jgi:hypothetical protein
LLATVSHAQESTPPIGCQTGVDSAAMLNAPNLFRVAASCAEEGRAMEAAFALIAGQLRATADMSSLKPSGEDDETKMVELYGFIYYRAGGTGTVELYRDPAQTERLFELIRQWQPQLPENYDPGWAYRQAPDKAKYFENLDYGRITRLLQLQHYALLARDDEYHAAQSEFAELQRKNPNGLSAGTADGDRAEYLMHAMQSASARIPEPRYPKPPKFEYVPDPDANFRQVYTGFNGLPEIETTIVMNRAEAEKAWWRTAIGEQAFGDLLAQADFEREMILVHTIGHRGAATGSVHLTDVRQRRDMNSISVSVMIGVNEEECEFKTADAYPFVVAVMARAEESPYVGSYSHSNFGDGCKQPKSAAPSKGAGQAP